MRKQSLELKETLTEPQEENSLSLSLWPSRTCTRAPHSFVPSSLLLCSVLALRPRRWLGDALLDGAASRVKQHLWDTSAPRTEEDRVFPVKTGVDLVEVVSGSNALWAARAWAAERPGKDAQRRTLLVHVSASNRHRGKTTFCFTPNFIQDDPVCAILKEEALKSALMQNKTRLFEQNKCKKGLKERISSAKHKEYM